MSSHEGCLLLVAEVHLDLIIARESIHEAKELIASNGVHYEVDPGHGKAVFRASSVHVSEVNAESPLAICLLDEDNISQPIRIIYFSDGSGLEEFADLLIDHLLPFWGETSSFLFDGFEGGGDIQLVGDNCWVNSSDVLLLPGEYVHVLF